MKFISWKNVQAIKHMTWIYISHNWNSCTKNCQSKSWTLHVRSLKLTYGYLYHTWLMVPSTWPKINYWDNYRGGGKYLNITGYIWFGWILEACFWTVANFSWAFLKWWVDTCPSLVRYSPYLKSKSFYFSRINLFHSA